MAVPDCNPPAFHVPQSNWLMASSCVLSAGVRTSWSRGHSGICATSQTHPTSTRVTAPCGQTVQFVGPMWTAVPAPRQTGLILMEWVKRVSFELLLYAGCALHFCITRSWHGWIWQSPSSLERHWATEHWSQSGVIQNMNQQTLGSTSLYSDVNGAHSSHA